MNRTRNLAGAIILKCLKTSTRTEYYLQTFWHHFFQGADFFKRSLSGGSFENCDLRGCDFKNSALQNINFSKIKCGRSYVRLLTTFFIAISAFYLGSSLQQNFQNVSPSLNEAKSIDDVVFYLMAFDKFFMIVFSWNYLKLFVFFCFYNIFTSKLSSNNINVVKYSWLGSTLKLLVLILPPLYSMLLNLVITSTSIKLTDLCNIGNILIVIKILVFILTTILPLFFINKHFLTSLLLVSTSFKNADLENIDFTNANLTGVDFTNVRLKNVNFQGANLDGAHYKNGDMIYHISTTPGLTI